MPLFRLHTKSAIGAALSMSDDRDYAPVGADRFLVSQLVTESRSDSVINLIINWTK